jgi:hypothetical protein
MIGIAIPCYKNHYHFIPSLLRNISESTIKPNQVVISCSSHDDNKTDTFLFESIPVTISYTTELLNVSQNRNRAAKLLNTKYISFIDADDLMHPKRIEFLLHVIKKYPNTSAIYHSYKNDNIRFRDDPFWEEIEPNIIEDITPDYKRGMGILAEEYPIHHAHVTIKKSVFSLFKFDEHPLSYKVEDSEYAYMLAEHGIPIVFLNNQLSRYIHN